MDRLRDLPKPELTRRIESLRARVTTSQAALPRDPAHIHQRHLALLPAHHRDLALLCYARDGFTAEVPDHLARAARVYRDLVTLREAGRTPHQILDVPPGVSPWEISAQTHPQCYRPDYSLTNTKTHLEYVYCALIGADFEPADHLLATAWDPDDASYISDTAELSAYAVCAYNDHHLAYALAAFARESRDEAIDHLRWIASETPLVAAKAQLFRALITGEAAPFLDCLTRLLTEHERAAAVPKQRLDPTWLLCLAALGAGRLAVRDDLVAPTDLAHMATPYFPDIFTAQQG